MVKCAGGYTGLAAACAWFALLIMETVIMYFLVKDAKQHLGMGMRCRCDIRYRVSHKSCRAGHRSVMGDNIIKNT